MITTAQLHAAGREVRGGQSRRGWLPAKSTGHRLTLVACNAVVSQEKAADSPGGGFELTGWLGIWLGQEASAGKVAGAVRDLDPRSGVSGVASMLMGGGPSGLMILGAGGVWVAIEWGGGEGRAVGSEDGG
jgi:hypothetical protein